MTRLASTAVSFALVLPLVVCAACKGGNSDPTAAGISMLGVTERAQLFETLGFDERQGALVLAAFVVSDVFEGDFGAKQELAIPLSTAPAGAAEGAVLALAKVETFAVLDNASRPRFVAPAIYETDGLVTIQGHLIARFVDEERRIDRDEGNQAGTYLLLAAPAGESFQLVAGTAVMSLSRQGAFPAGQGAPWDGATISVSSSPMLATTGEQGKFLAAGLAGRASAVAAIRTGMRDAPESAPNGAVRLVAAAGSKDALEASIRERAALFADPNLAALLIGQLPDVAGRTELLMERIPLVETRLAFEVPRLGAAFPLTDERDPPTRPTPDVRAEDLPPVGHATLRVDHENAPQMDLGCSGFGPRNEQLAYLRSGSEVISGKRGWRARGEARYAYDFAAEIFGAPEALGPLYLDNIPGYCVVTSGEGQASLAYGDPAYLPGPERRGLASDLSQSVLVPAAARSIQIRAAVLTQEYPSYLHSGLADALYFRFDESPAPIAHATLSELAADDAFKPLTAPMHGMLWGIESSPSAAPGGYTGYLPPRLFCRDLDPAREAGHLMTLRVGVTDGADRLLDTAVLIDAVVFATGPCTDPTTRMTSDPLITLD